MLIIEDFGVVGVEESSSSIAPSRMLLLFLPNWIDQRCGNLPE